MRADEERFYESVKDLCAPEFFYAFVILPPHPASRKPCPSTLLEVSFGVKIHNNFKQFLRCICKYRSSSFLKELPVPEPP